MNAKKIILILIVILLSTQVGANSFSDHFKKGDWFECEMEFENGVPVFREHNFNLPIQEKYRTDLLSIRFEYIGPKHWKYKILRYKRVSVSRSKDSINKSIYVFDTWYPDYFDQEFIKKRELLYGEITLKNRNEIYHYSQYQDFRFDFNTVIPYYPDGSYKPVNSTMSFNGVVISRFVEMQFEMLFHRYLNTNNNGNEIWWIQVINGEKATKEKALSDNVKNGIKKHELINELIYAFSDHNNQKVFAITNASFDIPNETVLTIIDQREQLKKERKYIYLSRENNAHIIPKSDNGIIVLDQKKGSKQIRLKCGVSHRLLFPNRYLYFYLEPGDSVTLTLKGTAEKFDIWCSNANGPEFKFKNRAINSTRSIPSEGYKAYMKLHDFLDVKHLKTWSKEVDIDNLKEKILNVYFLKSYHYLQVLKLIEGMKFRRDILVQSAGVPIPIGFENQIRQAQANEVNFSLYQFIFGILSGPFSTFQISEKNPAYDAFTYQCGDTLLVSRINRRINVHNRIKPGRILDIDSLQSFNGEKISVISSKKKYNLLHLCNNEQRIKSLDKMLDSISLDVNAISYRINGNAIFEKYDSLRDYKHQLINGTPIDASKLTYYTGNSGAMLILYDDKGRIIYSSAFSKTGNNNFPYDFSEEINAAIKKEKAFFKKEQWKKVAVYIPGILLSILLTLGITRIRARQIRKRHERDQLIEALKLESVQSQLNPHFLFNSLNSIQQLVNSNQNSEANSYLIGFSSLLRGVLQNSDKRLVSLSDELDLIQKYCELEQLRLDFDFNLDINTKENIDLIEIPYMLLQPLVENAIKHGISKVEQKGTLTITIQQKDDLLNIEISDDGIGFKSTDLDELIRSGKGLKLAIEKLNTNFNEDARLWVNNKEGNGAVVNIELKIG